MNNKEVVKKLLKINTWLKSKDFFLNEKKYFTDMAKGSIFKQIKINTKKYEKFTKNVDSSE